VRLDGHIYDSKFQYIDFMSRGFPYVDVALGCCTVKVRLVYVLYYSGVVMLDDSCDLSQNIFTSKVVVFIAFMTYTKI